MRARYRSAGPLAVAAGPSTPAPAPARPAGQKYKLIIGLGAGRWARNSRLGRLIVGPARGPAASNK